MDAALRRKSKVKVGEDVALEVTQAAEPPEPELPPELRKALAEEPAAKAQWDGLRPAQRYDWILWLTSGKRRVCCFDRSGIYSKGLSAPKPAR